MTTICTPVDAERTVLYVSSSPDQKLADFLAASGWQAVHAKSTAVAERMLERGNIKVGLVELPGDCTSQHLSALASCMRRVETNWVAQIVPGQAENELVSRFILDYCFDFVTRPWLNERLVFALGHAHGLSSLRQAPPVAPEPSLGRPGMVGPCAALPPTRSPTNSRERWIRLCRAARGRPLGGRERQRPWGQRFRRHNTAFADPSLTHS